MTPGQVESSRHAPASGGEGTEALQRDHDRWREMYRNEALCRDEAARQRDELARVLKLVGTAPAQSARTARGRGWNEALEHIKSIIKENES